MEPDLVLQELRQAVNAWENAPPASREEYEAAERATSAASALDDWISHGGFLPRDWLCAQMNGASQ